MKSYKKQININFNYFLQLITPFPEIELKKHHHQKTARKQFTLWKGCD